MTALLEERGEKTARAKERGNKSTLRDARNEVYASVAWQIKVERRIHGDTK